MKLRQDQRGIVRDMQHGDTNTDTSTCADTCPPSHGGQKTEPKDAPNPCDSVEGDYPRVTLIRVSEIGVSPNVMARLVPVTKSHLTGLFSSPVAQSECSTYDWNRIHNESKDRTRWNVKHRLLSWRDLVTATGYCAIQPTCLFPSLFG